MANFGVIFRKRRQFSQCVYIQSFSVAKIHSHKKAIKNLRNASVGGFCLLRFIPRLLQKSHKEQEIRTEMKEHLKRKLWKRNCLLIFSIFLFVTLVVIFSQNQYHDDIPPLDVKKSSSEGWALTGEISHIYGVVNSYTDFFEHGWIEAENSRNLQFSEFKPLHENYCLFYYYLYLVVYLNLS